MCTSPIVSLTHYVLLGSLMGLMAGLELERDDGSGRSLISYLFAGARPAIQLARFYLLLGVGVKIQITNYRLPDVISLKVSAPLGYVCNCSYQTFSYLSVSKPRQTRVRRSPRVRAAIVDRRDAALGHSSLSAEFLALIRRAGYQIPLIRSEVRPTQHRHRH